VTLRVNILLITFFSRNTTEFRSHHLRVDLATQSKVHDNKRSVFLGGLSFCKNDLLKHFSSLFLKYFISSHH
jgi:hypothetical protein